MVNQENPRALIGWNFAGKMCSWWALGEWVNVREKRGEEEKKEKFIRI